MGRTGQLGARQVQEKNLKIDTAEAHAIAKLQAVQTWLVVKMQCEDRHSSRDEQWEDARAVGRTIVGKTHVVPV
eukprot:6195398-Pleurochrysis_carterae.AAC.4